MIDNGITQGTLYPIYSTTNTIGRATFNDKPDIAIQSGGGTVSRLNGKIFYNGSFFLQDLESTNKIISKGKELDHRHPIKLQGGDTFIMGGIGGIRMRLITDLTNATQYKVKAQEFSNTTSSEGFVETKNSEIGVKIKYPENWTIQYTKGNNNSLATNPETFEQFIKDHFTDSNGCHRSLDYNGCLKNLTDNNAAYPTDSDKRQLFLKLVNTDCGITMDCRLIGDPYLQSYMRDSANFGGYISIFDYVPSISLLPPLENSTDNFYENVKIASFPLPHNSTLDEFIRHELIHSVYPITIDYHNCQSSPSGYLKCEIIYTFTVGDNLASTHYKTFQFFIEKNDKIYLLSYNALTDTYSKYIELVKVILKSLELL